MVGGNIEDLRSKITRDLSEQLQKAKNQKHTQSILSGIREIESDKRIIAAVRNQLEYMPRKEVDRIRDENPETVHRMFELAKKVISGDYGKTLKNEASALNEAVLSPQSLIIQMLVHQAFQANPWEKLPEIFSNLSDSDDLLDFSEQVVLFKEVNFEKFILNRNKLNKNFKAAYTHLQNIFPNLKILESTAFALSHIYRDFIANLANPSHLTVEMLIENEEKSKEAINTAISLGSRKERSRSISKIVKKFIADDKFDDAVTLLKDVKAKKVSRNPFRFLIDAIYAAEGVDVEKLISENQIDEAIKLAKSTTEPVNRDEVLKKIAIGITKYDQFDKALKITGQITSTETRDYVLSSIVNALSQKQNFKLAIKVAESISDIDFQEDAYGFAVKAMLNQNLLNEAVKQIAKIKDKDVRTSLARIILSHAVAHHDDKQIEMVRKKFDLA